jgi:hypothetical protein
VYLDDKVGNAEVENKCLNALSPIVLEDGRIPKWALEIMRIKRYYPK